MGMKITDDGAKNLMTAVVIQAVKDYRLALYKYNTVQGRGKKLEHRNVIGECELFFRKNLGFYCELDGEKIIQKIRDDVRLQLKSKGIIMEVPKFDGRRTVQRTDGQQQTSVTSSGIGQT